MRVRTLWPIAALNVGFVVFGIYLAVRVVLEELGSSTRSAGVFSGPGLWMATGIWAAGIVVAVLKGLLVPFVVVVGGKIWSVTRARSFGADEVESAHDEGVFVVLEMRDGTQLKVRRSFVEVQPTK